MAHLERRAYCNCATPVPVHVLSRLWFVATATLLLLTALLIKEQLFQANWNLSSLLFCLSWAINWSGSHAVTVMFICKSLLQKTKLCADVQAFKRILCHSYAVSFVCCVIRVQLFLRTVLHWKSLLNHRPSDCQIQWFFSIFKAVNFSQKVLCGSMWGRFGTRFPWASCYTECDINQF